MYVGSSFDVGHRVQGHLKALLRNKHDNKKLLSSWRKHGADEFSWAVLEQVNAAVLTKEQLNLLLGSRESWWCDFVDDYYNLALPSGKRGSVLKPEAIERRKAAMHARKVAEGREECQYHPTYFADACPDCARHRQDVRDMAAEERFKENILMRELKELNNARVALGLRKKRALQVRVTSAEATIWNDVDPYLPVKKRTMLTVFPRTATPLAVECELRRKGKPPYRGWVSFDDIQDISK
jgi:group I intron endonuclease